MATMPTPPLFEVNFILSGYRQFVSQSISDLFAGFHTSENYQLAQREAARKGKQGKMIYLQLSADSWKYSGFGKKSLGGVYASILNLPGDLRIRDKYLV